MIVAQDCDLWERMGATRERGRLDRFPAPTIQTKRGDLIFPFRYLEHLVLVNVCFPYESGSNWVVSLSSAFNAVDGPTRHLGAS